MTGAEPPQRAGLPGRWRVLAVAVTAQTVGTGVTLGALGALAAVQARSLGGSKALAAAAVSIVVLAMAVLAPVVGAALRRTSPRTVMLAGALALAAGHLALWGAGGRPLGFLLSYALLIGPGVCLVGVVPATTLVTQRFDADRGLALGIVTMPIGVLAAPPLVAALAGVAELDQVYLVLAAVCLGLMLPLATLPRGRAATAGASAGVIEDDPPAVGLARLTGLAAGFGLLAAPGVVAMAHLAGMGAERGLAAGAAGWLISFFGGAGAIGALAFGRLGDRWGPAGALAANGFLQACTWAAPAVISGPSALIAATALAGLCGGGVFGVFAGLVAAVCGARAYPRVIGLASLLALPFTCLAPPLAGWALEAGGGYASTFAGLSAITLAAGLCFGATARWNHRRRQASR